MTCAGARAMASCARGFGWGDIMIDHSQAARAEAGLRLLRIALAALLLAHGIARIYNDGVAPFAGWLSSDATPLRSIAAWFIALGVPFGAIIAWFVTLWELTATWLLGFGPKRWLAPICAVFIAIYACGIWLVHAPAGWFVVGAGRNGSEYSVLILVCLTMLAWVYWPAFRRRR
jgi:putative oxidoreductase